jgi:abortive infection bacteriophage resistance protein
MASTYNKPHLGFQQQLDQLKQRGLQVADDPRALDWLRRLGYYRLSAYWYPFRQRQIVQNGPNQLTTQVNDQFTAGATFDDAVALYTFDKDFALL